MDMNGNILMTRRNYKLILKQVVMLNNLRKMWKGTRKLKMPLKPAKRNVNKA